MGTRPRTDQPPSPCANHLPHPQASTAASTPRLPAGPSKRQPGPSAVPCPSTPHAGACRFPPQPGHTSGQTLLPSWPCLAICSPRLTVPSDSPSPTLCQELLSRYTPSADGAPDCRPLQLGLSRPPSLPVLSSSCSHPQASVDHFLVYRQSSSPSAWVAGHRGTDGLHTGTLHAPVSLQHLAPALSSRQLP